VAQARPDRPSGGAAALGVDVDALRAEAKTEIDAATEEALAAPMPDPSTATDGVFCEGEAEPLGDGQAPWSGFAGKAAAATPPDGRGPTPTSGEASR